MRRREFVGALTSVCFCGAAWADNVPGRIVSTAPSSTEALFALGLGRHVVGVSVYCEYPPEVKSLPKVGTYVKPDVEAIARLRPDLVVLQKHEGPITGRLQALGIRSVEMPYGALADVYAGIELVAWACDVPERGTALNGQIRRELGAVKAKSQGLAGVRVLVVADRRAGSLTDLVAVGPANYVSEMIGIAGGVNVLDQPGVPMYPHISLETILRANPQVIVDLADSYDSGAEAQRARGADQALWAQHPELQAVKAGRVSIGTSAVLLVPGPRSPQAAEMFFQYLHGGQR